MFYFFKNFLTHIDSKFKFEFIYLIGLAVLTSFFETITISLTIPLINIIVDGNANSKIYSNTLNYFFYGINANDLKIVSLLFIFSIICTTSLRLKLMWNSIKISNKVATEISTNIFEITLNQPYLSFVNQESSKTISAMSQKVTIVANTLMSLTTAITSLIILISIFLILLFNSFLITIISITFFIILYGFIYLLSKKILKKNGEIIANKFSQNIGTIQEGLGSIRDIILGGYQKLYINIYKSSFLKLQHVSGQNTFIAQSPRFLLEAFGMILIVLVALTISLYGNNKTILASLGLLLIGAQRMLPLCQQIYISIANIIGSRQNMLDVCELMKKNNKNINYFENINNINFNSNLEVNNLSFNYIKNKSILKNINLNVSKGMKVGVIGPTGTGKSTFFDILMGFLEPSSGSIKVDGVELNNANIYSWKKKISLIPQNIFLLTDSLIKNITFGEDQNKIDHDLLKNSLNISGLSQFIKDKKEGLDFQIKERGINLSGGQKQRVAIARSIYKNREILFMDEATNALDKKNEEEILKNIFNYNKNLTIFMSTHNNNNLKLCDIIIELNGDKVFIK